MWGGRRAPCVTTVRCVRGKGGRGGSHTHAAASAPHPTECLRDSPRRAGTGEHNDSKATVRPGRPSALLPRDDTARRREPQAPQALHQGGGDTGRHRPAPPCLTATQVAARRVRPSPPHALASAGLGLSRFIPAGKIFARSTACVRHAETGRRGAWLALLDRSIPQTASPGHRAAPCNGTGTLRLRRRGKEPSPTHATGCSSERGRELRYPQNATKSLSFSVHEKKASITH